MTAAQHRIIQAKRPGDCPDREPDGRYLSGHGYVRVRWKVAPRLWVEAYEHRWLTGFPEGIVHHRNGDKADNRPENLEVMGNGQHARQHNARINGAEASQLYAQGLSYAQVARRLGYDPATAYRAVMHHGQVRSRSEKRVAAAYWRR